MSNLDKIRDRLHINEIDKENRDKLFQDLTKAGGKVVDLDKEGDGEKTLVYDNLSKNIGNHNIKGTKLENPFRAQIEPSKKKKLPVNHKEKGKKVSWFALFWFQLNCTFSNIFNFSATQFTYAFQDLISKEAYNDFLLIKLYLDPIFQTLTPQTLQFRINRYRQDNLLEYEMAYRMYQLFDKKSFVKLQIAMENSVNNSEKELIKMFSPLYALYKYNSQLKISIVNILKLFKKEYPQLAYSDASIKNIDIVFFNLWGPIYSNLEQIVSYYWYRFNYKASQPKTLAKFLKINYNDFQIGTFVEEWKKQYVVEELKNEILDQATNLQIEDIADESSIYPDQTIMQGCTFIQKYIDFKKYFDTFHQENDLRATFQANDRIFYAYVLVDFFDSEFVFLWASDYINFYTVTAGSSLDRFDPKKEFVILNTKINQFYELVNEYLRMARSIDRIISSTKYRSQSIFIEQKNKELAKNSFSIRKHLIHTFTEFSKLTEKILNTQNTEDPLIGNWDEIIKINVKNQGNKIVNEKTILEIMHLVHEYTSAIVWLLHYSDLSGLGIELKSPKVISDELLINETE